MNKLATIVIASVLLSGCKLLAVPLAPAFPEAPASLQEKCEALKEATKGMSLSEYTKVVVNNYVLYHDCAVKVEGWNEWYAKQKQVYDEATKKSSKKSSKK